MGTVEALQARKQALDAEKLRLRAEAKALEIAIAEAERAFGIAQAELKDAQAWVALPRTAKKRILAMAPETVAAFCNAAATSSSERVEEWIALKLKKKKKEHIFMRTQISYPDTPEGAGVRIRCIRGREWCMKLDNESVNPA
jgi:hypothetical protein